MQDRSIGVMTLSVGSAIAGLYCQLAAVALLMSGSGFFATGSSIRAVVLVLGLAFLAVTIASYAAACGFWVRKAWSWNVGVMAFAGLIAASVAFALVSTNLASGLLPSLSAGIALWYLHRPAVRAESMGAAGPARVAVSVGEAMGVARQAR